MDTLSEFCSPYQVRGLAVEAHYKVVACCAREFIERCSNGYQMRACRAACVDHIVNARRLAGILYTPRRTFSPYNVTWTLFDRFRNVHFMIVADTCARTILRLFVLDAGVSVSRDYHSPACGGRTSPGYPESTPLFFERRVCTSF